MLRIFLKQHRSYIIVYVLNFILISYLVFVTGAAIDDRLISYAGLLSFVLLVLFLVWRFWQMRPLYEELSKSVMQLEDMKVNLPKKDAVTAQFVQYMDQQYKVGREALLEAEANNEQWRLLIGCIICARQLMGCGWHWKIKEKERIMSCYWSATGWINS